ncbi:EamA family transporter [Actinoplanes sp. NPDC051475]|uniref:DMT family transporter n=1 Tax=Actinoplanes sp. NPDC051475 TaxID=3157225 RepID=UPI00344EEF78
MSQSFMSSETSAHAGPPVGGARSGLIAIVVAGILWGTTGVVVQLIRQSADLSPVGIGFYRLAIAALALLLFIVRQLRPAVFVLRTRWWQLLLVGAGLGAYQALYFIAVAWGGVAIATVVSLGLAPVLITGWEAARSHRRPSRAALCSISGAVIGLTLITGFTVSPTGAAPRPLLGLLAALGSGLGYAATTVLSRDISRHVRPLTLTAASTAIGALTLLPFAWLSGGLVLPGMSAATWMVAYLGIVATAVAYALFYMGLRTTTGSVAVVLTLLEPLTAAIFAVVVLGEEVSLPVVLGGGLLLGAVVIASHSARTPGQGRRPERRPATISG